MAHPYDPKAVRILCDRYWSSKGWKWGEERTTSEEDFAYAKNHGVMFNEARVEHDQIISEVNKLAASLSTRKVSNAFLYSLSTRDLAYRSALGSFAVSYWQPVHRYAEGNHRFCKVCGHYHASSQEDLNVLNFMRIKWGGVAHTQPLYQLFDLREFQKLPEVTPGKEDVKIFYNILDAIRGLPAEARPRDAEKKIAAHLKSSKSEREILIQILGYCGILQPKDKPGFFREYTWFPQREDRPVSKIDWSYPVAWWQRRDGVNEDALAHYFPQLEPS